MKKRNIYKILERKRKRLLKVKLIKPVPLWLVLILILLGGTAVYAALTVQTKTYGSLFGEIIDVTEELTVVSKGVDISPSTKTAQGNVSTSPVNMTAAGNTSRTDISMGNYTYMVEVSVATVSAGQKYNCTLYKEQNDSWVYIDSLYVQQGDSPSVDDKALLTWDIGASLSSTVTKVVIEPYS